MTALAADLVATAIPGITGAGAAARGSGKFEAIKKFAQKIYEKAAIVGKKFAAKARVAKKKAAHRAKEIAAGREAKCLWPKEM